MNKKVWIYDLETLLNLFTYTAIDKDSDDVVKFVIWKEQNDLPQLLKHLASCAGHIGFNNLAFDANIINYILRNKKKLLTMSGDEIARDIYRVAQETIQEKWSNCRNPLIPELDLYAIHHFNNPARMTSLKKLEVALQFDNVQDMPIHHNQEVTTPEEVEIVLGYNLNDVKATKVFYTKTIEKIDLRKTLYKKYGINCLNMSDSKIGEELTLALYCQATNNKVTAVKNWRTTRENFKFSDCIPDYVNFTTPEFNKLFEYLKGIEVKELKQSFAVPSEDFEFTYRDIEFFLGTGGIHACTKEGIYESNEDYVIVDCDVAGMYPSIAKVNRYYPLHLGEKFCDVYENEIINPRAEAKELAKPKSGLPEDERKVYKVLADGFKLSGNSVYGKSNSEYSFLYDPLYTLKTTLTGQLSLCMLSEMLFVGIPELKMLQANTDGITVIIPRKDKRKYWEICQEWERITRLVLEYVSYEKMIIRDVNNYIATYIDKDSGKLKIKRKGIFKLHEEMRKEGEWHKGFNQGIVPIALSEYFLKDIPIEDTIKNHTNIYDFCKTYNVSGLFSAETYSYDESRNEVDIKSEQKTNRYYISNNGRKFRKRGEPLKPKYDKRITYIPKRFDEIKELTDREIERLIESGQVEDAYQVKLHLTLEPDDYRLFNGNSRDGDNAGYYRHLNYIFGVSRVEISRGLEGEFNISADKDWRLIDLEAGDYLVTLFNSYVELPFEKYNINYDYYIDEANKVVETVLGIKEQKLLEQRQEKERNQREKERLKYIESCINKQPTERMYRECRKEWMDGVYPEITDFKPSPKRKDKTEVPVGTEESDNSAD